MYFGRYFIGNEAITAFEFALLILDADYVQRKVMCNGTVYEIDMPSEKIFMGRPKFNQSGLKKDLAIKVGNEIVPTFSSIAYIHSETVRNQWSNITKTKIMKVPSGISLNGIRSAVELMTFGVLNNEPDEDFVNAVEFLQLDGWNGMQQNVLRIEDQFADNYQIRHDQEFNIGELFCIVLTGNQFLIFRFYVYYVFVR